MRNDIRDLTKKSEFGFAELVEIMKILRAPDGCPWDREQNHDSIRKNFIEETYEAVEAIDKKDDKLLCEELGDVMLQVVFHARIAEDEGAFDVGDVCDGICKKLIRRHPHIFGETVAETSEKVLSNWDEIKRREKGDDSVALALGRVPRQLPALMRAQKLQQKAKKLGLEFENAGQIISKLEEERAELEEALAAGRGGDVKDELGDILFTAVNLARFLGFDAEECLTLSADKFQSRAAAFEQIKGEDDPDKRWEKAKR